MQNPVGMKLRTNPGLVLMAFQKNGCLKYL